MSGRPIEQRWNAGAVIAERFRLLTAVENAPIGARWRADDGGVAVHLTLCTPRSGLSSTVRDATLAALRDFGHPNAATVLDAGVFEGSLYVATALSTAQPLRAWIAAQRTRDRAVSLRDARGIFVQVTQCLAVSHRADVALVHGFSLAGSVVIERRGDVQLVARLGDLAVLTLADPESVVLPVGASPEGPTVLDDLRGAGALLAELLTDVKIVGTPEPQALLATLSADRPDVDPSVWKIVRACLSTDPTLRPANMERVREMIREANWAPCEIRDIAPSAAPPVALSASAPQAPERARIVAVTSIVERSSAPPAPPTVATPPPPVAAPPPPVAASPPPVAAPPPPVAAPPPPPRATPAPPVAVPPPPPRAAPVVLPVPAPTIGAALSPRSFASSQSEATVLTVGAPVLAVDPDATIERPSDPLPSHELVETTRRASNPLTDRVAALPKAARALFEDESTTLHVPSKTAPAERESTAPGLSAPDDANTAPRVDVGALLRREDTAPESAGFGPDARPLPPLPDTPTLIPNTRMRPATLAPPSRATPPIAAPPLTAPARGVVVAPFDEELPLDETFEPAPRVATMAPPTVRFVEPPPRPPTLDDPGSSTMPVPVPVRAMPMMVPLAPPPRPAREAPPPSSLYAAPERSLLDPPLVWWLIAAVAGVVTLLIAVVATSR